MYCNWSSWAGHWKRKCVCKPQLTPADAVGQKMRRAVTRLEARQRIGHVQGKYAEGIRLIKQCRKILDAAEKKIQLLAKDEDGELKPAGSLEEPQGDAGQPTE